MDSSILELVLRLLREANFPADAAFPGQKCPAITGPVAAVHIEKVDRANLTVTVEVSILCPAELGGTRCELEALRAAEALRQAGAVCIQNGCEYNGLAQTYSVSILVTFTGVTGAEDCTLGPGFRVYVQGNEIPFVVSFEAQYEMGEDPVTGSSNKGWIWKLQLEELIPGGEPEVSDPDPDFEVRLERNAVTETYSNCHWTSVRREFTRQGLRRIRTGVSLLKLENSQA